MGLYAVLGVAKAAKRSVIQKAYRWLALQYHEAAERFRQVQQAWDVLGDADKRARYDRTGEVEDKSQSQSEANALVALQTVYFEAIKAVAATPSARASQQDMLDIMRQAVKKKQTGLEEQLRECETTRKTIKDTQGRFSTTDGSENYLEQLAQALYARGEVEMAEIRRQLDIGMDCLALLGKICYRRDSFPDLRGLFARMAGTTSASASSTFYSVGVR